MTTAVPWQSPTLDTSRVSVIAEAGVNHNGDPGLAHLLVDLAAESGADAVKFQTFDPAQLASPSAATTPYQRASGHTDGQAEMLAALVLPRSLWPELAAHADEVGVAFLSTPFDIRSAEMLTELGVDALKIGSGELTNHDFLRDVAGLGKPLILSTGMGTLAEVASAVEVCAAAPLLTLLHCVSAYPAPADECNLLTIPAMAAAFDVAVGWSDHTTQVTTALLAVALGARVLEKHMTTDRTLPGPDHAASLEPDEMREYVEQARAVPSILGDGIKRRMPSEEENASLVRRSWHATRNLPRGHSIRPGDLVALRPESGISAAVPVLGRVLLHDVPQGDPLTSDSLEQVGP